jgi:thymidylate synthase (FAD)
MLIKGIIKVGYDGFVQYVNHMGSDEHIYEVATDTVTDATKRSDIRTLLRRMIRHAHSSSFEFGEIEIRAQTPFYIWRQMIRHRASPIWDETTMYDEPSVNELSGRYSKVLDSIEETCFDEWRKQSRSNRQGSEGYFCEEDGVLFSNLEIEVFKHIKEAYSFLLSKGVAKEQARRLWPMAGYTRGYMKMDLWNWLHFCKLRLAPDAQTEIREFANAIYEEILKKLFPIICEAFEDYILHSITFSNQELQLIKILIGGQHLLGCVNSNPQVLQEYISNKTEQGEFRAKIERILDL